MRVVVFGTYDKTRHPRVAVLADGLRAHGAEVFECNAPLGLETKDRVAILARPHRIVILLAKLARRWFTLARRSRALPRPDVVLVGYMGHFDVHLARVLYPTRTLVLDHLIGAADTAIDRGHGGGLKGRLLRWLDAAAQRSANVVVVDTEEQLALLTDRGRKKAVVVDVGAPESWFDAAASAPGDDTQLRVVFFGLFTPLQGTPVVGQAASLLADEPVSITIIGGGQDEPATRAAASGAPVEWIDWVDSAALPKVVAGHDVCLGIFGTTGKAQRVVPNKVFQGAAAGCAIVTSGTPPQRRLLGDAAVFVPPGDARALASALRTLAHDRDHLHRMRQAAQERAAQHFTAHAIATPLWQRLSQEPGRPPRG